MNTRHGIRAAGLLWSVGLAVIAGCSSGGGTAQGPSVVLNIPPAPIAPGESFQFIGTVDGDSGVALLWSLPAGVTAGVITTEGLYTAGATPGVYQVVAKTATDPQGADTSQISVIADPVVSFTSIPDSVDPAAGAASVSVTNLPNVTYQWTVTGGVINGSSNTHQISFTALDTSRFVNISVIVTNLAGHSGSVTDSVRVLGHYITVLTQAYGVAIGSTGTLAMAEWQNGTVTFRSGTDRGIIRQSVVGGTPVHIAFSPDGGTLYVIDQDGFVKRITVSSGAVTTAPYGHPMFNLAVDPSTGALYVTSGDGWLFRADPTTLAKLDSLPLASASNGAAFGGGTFWVSTLGGRLYKIDPATLDVADSLDLGGTPQRVAVSSDGATVYVANEGGPDLQVITTATKAVTSIAIAGAPYGLALSPSGSEVWVAVRDQGRIQRISTSTGTGLGSITIGGVPRNVAFSADGQSVLVGAEQYTMLIHP